MESGDCGYWIGFAQWTRHIYKGSIVRVFFCWVRLGYLLYGRIHIFLCFRVITGSPRLGMKVVENGRKNPLTTFVTIFFMREWER